MNKTFILKALISFVCLVAILVPQAYSFVLGNGTSGGYDEGAAVQETGSRSIEDYIIEGAAYYLEANANIQALLKMVELQNQPAIDYNILQTHVQAALDNILKAALTYEGVIKKAEATPYNPLVIEQLRNVDYQTFIQVNGLNPVWFGQVQQLLQAGDLTAVLKENHTGLTNIATLLTMIDDEVSQARLPDLTLFWQLNEAMARRSTIGSYVARLMAGVNPQGQ